MLISALIDLGATSQFIDIDYVQSKNLCTQCLPRSHPCLSCGDPYQVGHITEVIDLIVQYGDHLERATFHVTGIGRMTIILGHTWLVEHNPEIDWSTGKVCMNRCSAACAPNATADDTN